VNDPSLWNPVDVRKPSYTPTIYKGFLEIGEEPKDTFFRMPVSS